MKGDDLKTKVASVLGNVERIGFTVVTVISNHNSVNRRAFQLLSPTNTLEPFTVHSLDDKRLLFFVFGTEEC